jgi:hypothetical protein
LASSTEDFVHSNGLVTWNFDKSRRGFVITNAGLSINAELFEIPGNLPGGESLYIIKLNCSWGWPPLEASRSPMVLFLQSTQEEIDFSNKQPLTFKRISSVLRSWNEISSIAYHNRGRQDILITDDREFIVQNAVSKVMVALKYPEMISLGVIQRFHQDRSAQTWRIVDHVGSPAELEVLISQHQAAAMQIKVHGLEEGAAETPQRNYLIIVKWGLRFPSFGIWERTLPSLGGIFKLLDSDRELRYPSSVHFEESVIRIAMIPKPSPMTHSQKQVCLQIMVDSKPIDPSLDSTTESLRRVLNYTIPRLSRMEEEEKSKVPSSVYDAPETKDPFTAAGNHPPFW